METSSTKTKESVKMELLALPDEMLLEVFKNFNDIDLLNMTEVCERFKAIAKEIIPKKYNGASDNKYIEVRTCIYDTGDLVEFYCKYLEIFGDKIIALRFIAESKRCKPKQKLIRLISRHCNSVKYIVFQSGKHEDFAITKAIHGMHKLTSLTLRRISCAELEWADERFPHLTSLYLDDVKNIDVDVLKRFIYINPQLKDLRVADCRNFPLTVIQELSENLNGLKSLELTTSYNHFPNKCRDIKVESLETLKISTDGSSTAKVLGAIARGSKNIQHLELSMRGDNSMDVDETCRAFEDSIRLFDKLTSLKLDQFKEGINLIQVFSRNLPHLVALKLDGVQTDQMTLDDILLVFKMSKHFKELSLQSESTTKFKLNLEFHQKFREIIEDRGKDIKLKIITAEDNILITEEKMMKNGELLYWTGYDVSVSKSKVHLFDLNHMLLKKIFDYLIEEDERALYETCTKMKRAMESRINSQEFIVSDENSAKDVLNRFGEHITKLKLDMNTNSHSQMAAIWDLVNEKCSKSLIELSINKVIVKAMSATTAKFPNLVKLKVSSVISNRTHIFPPMECPKLQQLEFCMGDITQPTKTSQFGISLSSLTAIKLNYFDDGIEGVLKCLSNEVCSQVREFTVEKMNVTGQRIVNIAMRFRSLTKFNFMNQGLPCMNCKYLFQSCTKLEKLCLLTDFYDDNIDEWRKMLQYIKENCKSMKLIKLIHDDTKFYEDLLIAIVTELPKVQLNTVYFNYMEWKYITNTYIKQRIKDKEPQIPY